MGGDGWVPSQSKRRRSRHPGYGIGCGKMWKWTVRYLRSVYGASTTLHVVVLKRFGGETAGPAVRALVTGLRSEVGGLVVADR